MQRNDRIKLVGNPAEDNGADFLYYLPLLDLILLVELNGIEPSTS
jgi:hypothetical protein